MEPLGVHGMECGICVCVCVCVKAANSRAYLHVTRVQQCSPAPRKSVEVARYGFAQRSGSEPDCENRFSGVCV
jgi:hypothetical protein